MRTKQSQLPLYLMVVPAIVIVFIYSYVPMAGLVIAFQKFVPAKGLFGPQRWVGLGNFAYLLQLPTTFRVVRNTVALASMKIIVGMIVPIILALLLDEVRHKGLKRSIQTVIYMPHFLSWVILAGILVDVLSPSRGIVNRMLGLVGLGPVNFLGDQNWFPFTMVVTSVWKEAGFSTIVYLAAITSISPILYEAAVVDGANRWQQIKYITLPGMMPIIVLMATLSLRQILNAGFDQILTLYSPQVYSTGDILDTMVYRIGLIEAQYSLATAVGLFKGAVSAVFVALAYYLAYRFADYRIF